MTRAPGDRIGGAANLGDGEEDEIDVTGAERHSEMALAGMSELYRSLENPRNRWLIGNVFAHQREAHQMLFGERRGAA